MSESDTDYEIPDREFSEDELEKEREPFDPTELGPICNFVWAVLRTDDDSYRDLPTLADEYKHSFCEEAKAGIDAAFRALCGWTFGTIILAAETRKSLHDARDARWTPDSTKKLDLLYRPEHRLHKD